MPKNLLPLLFSLVLAPLVHAAEPYHFLKEIPVGGDTGWDCLNVDSSAQRLYVSHGTKVVVVDLAKDAVAGEVTNTPGVHALVPAPEFGRGMATCGKEDRAAVVDLKTLQILSKLPTGGNPDVAIYEPGQKEFYSFNGRGQSATVIDAKSAQVVATIPLGGKPEFAQADAAAGLVFVNLEDKNEVAVIDVKTRAVIHRWPIAPGEAASGLALDAAHHRLFLGCDNHLLAMLDSTSGKVLATVPLGEGVDGCAFDPATQLVFGSCGDGATTIAREDGDTLTPVQLLKTEKGARTMAIDPATHKIYLPSAKFEAPAPGQKRGKMIPGTFKIMVFGTDK
jgi:DNA-binding beta-propeller fold protein YncE